MTLFARFALLLVLILVPSRLLAQTETATPAPLPIAFDETLLGTVPGRLEEVTYHFDVPQDQDVLMVMDSDQTVYLHYCIEVTNGGGTQRECPGFGGGGSVTDLPISMQLFIAHDSSAQTRQAVDVSVFRPLDGAADYQLTIYPMTPQPLTLGEDRAQQADAAHPYQVYTLQADPEQPFTVEIEDTTADGGFLWVAYQPYRAFFYTQTNDPTVAPQQSDSASSDAEHGVKGLSLEFVGGTNFRVIVEADDDYTLHSTDIGYQTLHADTTASVSLSYRDPLRVLRLNNAVANPVDIQVTLTDGTSVLGDIYTAELPYGRSIVLGDTPEPNHTFPLSETFALTPSATPILVVLQIPSVFSRDSLDVEVFWEPVAA